MGQLVRSTIHKIERGGKAFDIFSCVHCAQKNGLQKVLLRVRYITVDFQKRIHTEKKVDRIIFTFKRHQYYPGHEQKDKIWITFSFYRRADWGYNIICEIPFSYARVLGSTIM